MTRRACAGRRAILLALVALVGAGHLVGATAPAGAAGDSGLPPALVSLQDCVRERGRLSVLFMIDESKSLSDGSSATDPRDERVPGMKAALSGLRRLAADGSGRRAEIEVAFSGFSTDARKVDGWQDLDGTSLSQLERVAEGFASRDQGRGTDYEAALRLASGQLLERAGGSSGSAGSCSALIFFTDGKYQRADKDLAAQERGRAAMCRTGGLADQLRRAGVTTIVVSLSHFDATSSDFLQGLADGSSAKPCGGEGAPETGVYIPVERAEDLFFRLGFPGGDPKEGDRASFDTVPGLRDFLVRASIPTQGQLSIEGPGGARKVVPRGRSMQFDLASTRIDVHWTTRTLVEVSGTFAPAEDDWQGPWTVGFGTQSRYTAFLDTAYDLSLRSPRTFRMESPAKVVVQLADRGRPATGPLVDQAALTVSVKEPGARSGDQVAMRRSGPGRWAGEYTPPDTAAGQLQTSMRASFPPRGDADVLPVERIERRDTAPPIEFPDVRPHVLSLGTIRGREDESITTEADLKVVGSSVADGCVWLSRTQIEGPNGVHPTVAADDLGSSKATCLQIERNGSTTVPVRVTVDHVEDGTVQAHLHLEMYSEKAKRSRSLDLPVEVRLGRERNPWILVEVLFFASILGLLVPALILHLINRITGKLSPAHRTRMHAMAVVVERNRVTDPDGRDLHFPTADYYESFRLVSNRASSASRELRVAPLVVRAYPSGSFRRHRWAPSLLRGPMALASTTSRDRLYAGSIRSRRPLRSLDAGRIQEVPMALGGTWIFLPDPLEASTAPGDGLRFRRTGRLWIFTSGTGGLDQPAEVVRDLNNVLPGKIVMAPGEDRGDDDPPGRIRAWFAARRGTPDRPASTRPASDPNDPFAARPGKPGPGSGSPTSPTSPPNDHIDGW